MASPLQRPTSLGDQLAKVLRAQIVRGTLAPGTHLVEDALAAEHDVSRGPVRDAFKMLLAEGLVDSRRRGLFVKGFSAEDIDELYQVRVALECLASELAIASASETDWDVADVEVTNMRAAADASDWNRFAVHDLAFHSVLYTLSGNERLVTLWQQYQPTFAALLEVTNAQDRDLHPSADDHAHLLRLAHAGETDSFNAHLRDHLAGSKRRMRTAMTTR